MNLKALPKVELHNHLEGAIRYSTTVELAKAHGLDLPYDNPEALRDALCVTKPMKNLKEVLDKFDLITKFANNYEFYERITYEACEDAHKNGVKLLELRYAPWFSPFNYPDMTMEKVHEAVLKGADKARKDFNMGVGLIGLISRIFSVEKNQPVADFIIECRKDFCAIDLADNEDGFDSKPFAPFFEKAKEAGLKITVHAGEVNTKNAPKYPKDAVEFLHADRIGHGVQIYRDPEMIEFIKNNNITLELCPLSNWLTNAIESKEAHPFRQLFEAGVKTTISSDDQGVFGSSILTDYEFLADYHGFTEEEFKTCNQYAYDACFIPDKQNYWLI